MGTNRNRNISQERWSDSRLGRIAWHLGIRRIGDGTMVCGFEWGVLVWDEMFGIIKGGIGCRNSGT